MTIKYKISSILYLLLVLTVVLCKNYSTCLVLKQHFYNIHL